MAVTTIGGVARRVGVNVQTIRYYERIGLLPRPARTAAGYRIYAPETAERLRFIKQAQALGFSLEEIKEILRLRYTGRSPCRCVRERLKRKLGEIEEQLQLLRGVRQQIRESLKRSERLPRLPHSASAICPIIQVMPAKHRKGVERS